MTGRGSGLNAARLLCAAAVAGLVSVEALAQPGPTPASPASPPQQSPDAAELDPSAPLAPLPDLGVPWPDLKANEARPVPPPPPTSSSKRSI
ncbi:MAG TPA: hypothetical protein VM711_03930, partial [Sphingomicrobium sp.]|nr:hypothetical protein [Sphingomicrobium sp.]